MAEASRAETIRQIFAAYLANDRKFVENALSRDFRFTRPSDDAIDMPTYFERCWKNSDWIERQMAKGGFAVGEDFGLADCAAAPSLFYGSMVVPFGEANSNLSAYFERLKARPSFARVMQEAEPYFQMVPKES